MRVETHDKTATVPTCVSAGCGTRFMGRCPLTAAEKREWRHPSPHADAGQRDVALRMWVPGYKMSSLSAAGCATHKNEKMCHHLFFFLLALFVLRFVFVLCCPMMSAPVPAALRSGWRGTSPLQDQRAACVCVCVCVGVSVCVCVWVGVCARASLSLSLSLSLPFFVGFACLPSVHCSAPPPAFRSFSCLLLPPCCQLCATLSLNRCLST